jgi:hypothetical protein
MASGGGGSVRPSFRLSEQEILDQGLLESHLVSAPSGPPRVVCVSPVERVMDDHLPSGEELHVGTADAEVLNLLVHQPVLAGHDVERLAHARGIGRGAGRLKSTMSAPPPASIRR